MTSPVTHKNGFIILTIQKMKVLVLVALVVAASAV